MKVALFSDVHGNLDALDAVLDHVSRAGVDRHVCLGDIVGYGANPNECIDRLRAIEGCICLRGNHDAAVLNPAERAFFHEVALEGIRFTERCVTDENREYLSSLDYVYTDGRLMAVHASPYRPREWEYVLDQEGAERAFDSMGTARVAFIGHSHAPVIFCDDGTADRFTAEEKHVLALDRLRYVVNVGSVGQPRDGNPDASYVLYDSEEDWVKIFRVQYDREKAAEKILKAGLPPVLAERLLVGY